MTTATTHPAVARRPIRRQPFVTVDYLRALGACVREIAIFEAEWPQGTRLTRTALRRAAELDLDLGWFGYHALKQPGRLRFDDLTSQALNDWYEFGVHCEDDARLERAHADAIFAVLKEFPDALKVAP